ncbi:YeeE/YedE family protein [Corallococcus macrosporus]|uniref:YeeE/YedE family protein n=1 Tax=Corallococcus macrosporus TaxID=35 RepID=A0ABS3DIY1_9BACT|nr:DUF6691 family protein [Corallococcus macrosporus]MBN8231272.1 YeeE/YedE family protein [Corallococcus macrosporus]
MKAALMAGLAGILFSLGLGLGGMTDPAKVVGFLDVAGDWQPGLAFVMAGAMGTYALLRRLILRQRRAPVLAPTFPALGNARPDARLVAGAALFGAGWGLAGYCPGPAFTSVGSGANPALLFVAAMVGGMLLFQLWEKRPVPARVQAPVPQR